jgi:hypothetical protein
VGGAASWAAWGEPARPGFPRRGNGKRAIQITLLPQADFYAGQSRKCLTRNMNALYVPTEWVEEQPRRGAAGVPEEIRLATQPVLARQRIERAFVHGTPACGVSGDAV